MSADTRFDAIVIGSGVSGGWAAKELTEKGLRVLMLDRGVMVEHGQYDYESTPAYEIPYRNMMPPRRVERDWFVQRWVDPDKEKYFLNDRLFPYAYEDGDKFIWRRPGSVGGKSLTWGRWALRWGPNDFEANRKEGVGIDWPIRYDDLAPWYDYVEEFAGVSGSQEGIAHFPDGKFMPPVPMNLVEKWFKGRLEAEFPGRKLIHARIANITQDRPDQGRTRCQSRDQCGRGCSFGAYFSTQAVTLPAARKTGRLTLRANAVVSSLAYDPASRRVTGVKVFDVRTGAAEVIPARLVFLCASAMASNQILLNSRPDGSGDSYFNGSGVLGRYIMDHWAGVRVIGRVSGFDDFYEYGRRPGGVYVPRFRNLAGDEGLGFTRGYGYQGIAWRLPSAPVGFGAAMKHGMRKYAPWHYSMTAFGECLPYFDNRASLHPTKVDRFGIPQMLFNVTFRGNEERMWEDARLQGAAMLTKAGMTDVRHEIHERIPGSVIHESGGAPMGADPRRSVLNRWSQAHDAANLFVTDGAQMSSVACVNPSLTFMALTARAAAHAVDELKAGRI